MQAIIAVGFKVNNQRAVQFRKWAGQIVKDHTIQGWTMDVERAKLHAETEYEKYRIIQDRLYESDFDRFLMLEQEVNHKDEV